MDAVCVLGASDIIGIQRASLLPIPNSLDLGCPCGADFHRGSRRWGLVERVLLATRCIAQRRKAVVEIERGLSHERGGGIRLRAKCALQLVAPPTNNASNS